MDPEGSKVEYAYEIQPQFNFYKGCHNSRGRSEWLADTTNYDFTLLKTLKLRPWGQVHEVINLPMGQDPPKIIENNRQSFHAGSTPSPMLIPFFISVDHHVNPS